MDPKTLNQGARSIVAPEDLLAAKRYWWLRERPSLIDWDSWIRPVPHYANVTPELLDAEIDAAMAESQRQALQGLSDSAFPGEVK